MPYRQPNTGNAPAPLVPKMWPNHLPVKMRGYWEFIGPYPLLNRVTQQNATVVGAPVFGADGMVTTGDANYLITDIGGGPEQTLVSVAECVTPILYSSGPNRVHLISNWNVNRGGSAIILQGSAGSDPSSDRMRGRARWANTDAQPEITAGNQRGYKLRVLRVSTGTVPGMDVGATIWDLTQDQSGFAAPAVGATRTLNTSDRFRIGSPADAGWNGVAKHAMAMIIEGAVTTEVIRGAITGWCLYRSRRLNSALGIIKPPFFVE